MLKLVKALWSAGLLVLSTVRRAVCSCCAVAKKDNWLRLIFDVRRANMGCRAPPKTALSTAVAITSLRLRNIDVTTDRPLESIIVPVYLSDGFYQFWRPAMCQYFSPDCVVQAYEVGAEYMYDDDGVHSPCQESDWGFPCLATVTMGWSWGVYVCHSVMVRCAVLALQLMCLTAGQVEAQVVTDGRESPSVRPGAPAVLVYVDNCGMLCWDTADPVLVRHASQVVFDWFGLSYT